MATSLQHTQTTEDSDQTPHIPPQSIQPTEEPRPRKSQVRTMAARTEVAMIRIAEGGDLPTIAAELKIPVATLAQRIALYGLRSAQICILKGVPKQVLHETMARCDTGPDPHRSLFVPVALQKAEASEEERWIEV